MLPHIHRYSLCRAYIYLCRILRNPHNYGPRTTDGTLKLYSVRLSAVNMNIERKHGLAYTEVRVVVATSGCWGT